MWKYCDIISFSFFSLFFYPPHTYRISFFFFFFFFPLFFSLPHTYPYTFLFFTSFLFLSLPLPPNSRMFQLFLFIYLFILSTSLATPMQFFTLIFLILFFFSKFNHLQTGWFRSGRLDQSRANTDGYKLHLKDFAIFWCFLFCILRNPNLQGIDFFFFSLS